MSGIGTAPFDCKALACPNDQHKGVCFPFWGCLAFAAFLNSLDDQPILL